MAEPKKKRPPEDDFVGALAFFVVALGLSEDQIRDARARAARQGLSVAVHSEAQAIRAIWEESEAARELPLAEGKARIREALAAAWASAEAHRVAMMANLSTQASYQRGRWMEYRKRPGKMLRYTSALEPRTCEYCRGLHGVTLPEGDAWWQSHWPPQHGRCLCTVIPVGDVPPTQSPPSAPPPMPTQPPGTEFVPDYSGWPPEVVATAATKR